MIVNMLNEDVMSVRPISNRPLSPIAPLRVGIVGTGFMGRVHAQAARSAGARIVGLVGSTAQNAMRQGELFGSEFVFDSLEGLLDNDLDVVHICTPNSLHRDMVLAVLAAGVNVICEKPLATSLDDATDLARSSAQQGLVATVPFVYRFHPMVRELKHRLRSQTGRSALVSGSYLQDWLASPGEGNWRVDPQEAGLSRVFADIGSHWFDLMEFVLESRVSRLSARFATHFPDRVDKHGTSYPVSTEDSVTVQFELENGVLGVFSASQVASGRKNKLSIEVSGDQLSLAFDQENPEQVWVGQPEGNLSLLRDPAILGPDAARLSRLPAGHPQGYNDCFHSFVADTYAAVRGEVHAGLPTFEDGLRSALLIDRVVASALAQGEWVDCRSTSSIKGGRA